MTLMRNGRRSEEHTSELQSRLHLVCRLLLEKKKKKKKYSKNTNSKRHTQQQTTIAMCHMPMGGLSYIVYCSPRPSLCFFFFFFFFFNDTATTEIYTLSLYDALPISRVDAWCARWASRSKGWGRGPTSERPIRSEEHTSELQSRLHLVCRLLLEK